MYAQVEKPKANKSGAAANEVSQKHSSSESTFQFVDNRPEAIAQRKLQEMANISPNAVQLRAYREMAKNSPQVKQAAQLPAMVNGKAAPVTQRQAVIQRVNAYWNNRWAETPLGLDLTRGIDGTAAADVILQGLMNNFRDLGGRFNYTKRPGDFNAFLGGNLTGDCGTLARAFKAIGEEYYNILGITTQQWGDCWVQAGPTPYGGNRPDCDGGNSWIFGSHTYASYGGTVYDILFCTNNLAPKVDMGPAVNSEFFPDGDYYVLTDGSIAYSIGATAWHRILPDLGSQVLFLLRNGFPMLLRALGRLLMGGLNALADGIGWIVNKVRAWIGNEEEEFGALRNLRDRNE